MRAQLVWGIYPPLVLAVGPNPRTEGAAGPFPRRGSRLQRGWKLTRDRAPHSCCSRALLRALGYGSFCSLQAFQRSSLQDLRARRDAVGAARAPAAVDEDGTKPSRSRAGLSAPMDATELALPASAGLSCWSAQPRKAEHRGVILWLSALPAQLMTPHTTRSTTPTSSGACQVRLPQTAAIQFGWKHSCAFGNKHICHVIYLILTQALSWNPLHSCGRGYQLSPSRLVVEKDPALWILGGNFSGQALAVRIPGEVGAPLASQHLGLYAKSVFPAKPVALSSSCSRIQTEQ